MSGLADLLVLFLLTAGDRLVVLKDETAIRVRAIEDEGAVLVLTTPEGGTFSVRRADVREIRGPEAEPEAATAGPAEDPQAKAAPRREGERRPGRRGRGTLSVMGEAGSARSEGVRPGAKAGADAPDETEEHWRGRADALYDRIEELAKKVADLEARKGFFEGLQLEIVRRGGQPFVTGDLLLIESELQAQRPVLAEAFRALDQLKEEARRAGVPRAWVLPNRPGWGD